MTQRYRLPPRYEAVVKSVHLFGQLTTSQICRVHFMTGSPKGRTNRTQRTLRNLIKLDLLERLPRPRGGLIQGSGEFIYIPPLRRGTGRHRGRQGADEHTWQVAQMWAAMVEALGGPQNLLYYPEKHAYTKVGKIQLKPDAYIIVGERSYFVELDLNNEAEYIIKDKMRRYARAADSGHWPSDREFPPIVWAVPDPAQKQFIQDIIHRMREDELAGVYLIEEVAEKLTQG